MNLFSKPILTWKEPEAFRLSQDRRFAEANKRLRPLSMGVFIILMLLNWAIAKATPHQHPPDFVVVFSLMTGLGCLLFYLYPWWLRRCPSVVNFHSSAIMKMGDQSPRSFKQMAGFNWSEESSYDVLHLITKKGRALSYGVPDSALRQKIDAHLRAQGLPELRQTKP